MDSGPGACLLVVGAGSGGLFLDVLEWGGVPGLLPVQRCLRPRSGSSGGPGRVQDSCQL